MMEYVYLLLILPMIIYLGIPYARKTLLYFFSVFFEDSLPDKKQRRDIRRARWAREGFIYNSHDYKS